MLSRKFSVILISLLILALGLILAACGGNSPQADPVVITATPNEPQAETDAAGQVATIDSPEQELFAQACSACHGPDGTGIPGLGKDLIASEFVGGLNDEQLLTYIRTGRDVDDPLNTTGVPMPPSGGRPDLSDDDMLLIIAHIRTINTQAGVDSAEVAQYLDHLQTTAATEADAAKAEEVEEAEAEEETEAEEDNSGSAEETEAAEAEESAAAEISTEADIEAGQHLFVETCAACHNQQGTGIEGIGVDLTTSTFVGYLTTSQLVDFIIMGRGLNNPFNQSGIRMPARGGQADLSDEAVLNIAAYLHSINSQIGTESNLATEYLAWLEGGGAEVIETVEEVSYEGLAGPALDGQTTFFLFCAVCHGPQGQGVESLGRGLIDNDYVSSRSDEDLIELISTGRPADAPSNVTKIEMLPYGGQDSLSDEELTNLVAYIRFINAGSAAVAARPSDVVEEEDEEDEGLDHEIAEAEAFAIIDGLAPKCFVCHRISERGNKNGPGPNLNGLGSLAGERVPGLSAREYVEEAIVDPSAFVVAECPAGPCVDAMPQTFGGQLSEADLDILVSFLLSLTEER